MLGACLGCELVGLGWSGGAPSIFHSGVHISHTAGGRERGSMSLVVPPAHKLDEKTGEYGVTDDATSCGDIGVQVPVFPVVWVRARRCFQCTVVLSRRLIVCSSRTPVEGQKRFSRRSTQDNRARERLSHVWLGDDELQETRMAFRPI